MNNPIAFEQDAEAPPGTGTFHFEDGSKLYAMEPDLAASVRQKASQQGVDVTGPSPGRLASNDGQDPAQAALLSRLQQGAPPASKVDAYAGLGTAPAAAAEPQKPAFDPRLLGGDNAGLPGKFQAGLPPAAASDPGPAPALPAPGTIGPPPPPGWQPPPGPPPPRPRVSWAGRDPAAEAASLVPVPTKGSQTIEREGMPYSPELAELRERANQGVVEAKLAEFGVQKARAEQQATALQATLPALKQQEAEQKAAFQKVQANYQAERDRVRQYIADYDKQAKPDPGRFWKSGFGAPAVAMIIGQALGAYSAVLAHGDNFAQRMVEDAWNKDLEAQREEIQQGRIGQQNMLAKLNDQLGDMQQAESAWKILQSEVHDREVKSYAAAAQSQDVQLAANTWLAQNREFREREEEKFMNASFGKQTATTSMDMVLPRQGGSRPMTDEELENKQIKDNERGVRLTKSENELHYQQGGGEHGEKAAEAKAKANDPELYVEGFGTAKSKKEAIALRAAKAEYAAREKMLDRMEQLNHKAASAVGVGNMSTDEKIEAEQLTHKFKFSIAKDTGGVVTDSDMTYAEGVTPDPTSIFSGAQDVKIRTAREESRNKLQASIDEIVSGNHPELPEERKGKGE